MQLQSILLGGLAFAFLPRLAHTYVGPSRNSPPAAVVDHKKHAGLVLAAAVHPDIKPSDVSHLHPANSLELFFRDPAPTRRDVSTRDKVANPDVAAALVKAPVTAYSVVVLDNCKDVVSRLVCGRGGTRLSLRFTLQTAGTIAKTKWTQTVADHGSFVAISSDPSCADVPGEYVYMLVKEVTPSADGLGLIASIKTYIDLASVIGEKNTVTVKVGKFALSDAEDGGYFTAGSLGGDVGGNKDNAATTNPKTNPKSNASPRPADFDVALDQSIGFLDIQDKSYWNQLYHPGGDDQGKGPAKAARSQQQSDQIEAKNRLSKRDRVSWSEWVANKWRVLTSTAGSVIIKTEEVIATAILAIEGEWFGEFIVETALAALTRLGVYNPRTIITPIDAHLDLPIETPPSGPPSNTPWGPGTHVFAAGQVSDGVNDIKEASIDVYCVGCGVHGALHVHASITVVIGSLSFGEGSKLGISGNFNAAFKLGFRTRAPVSLRSYSKTLFQMPLSALNIPGVLHIGPELVVKIGGTLNVATRGDLLAGYELDWPAIDATLDLASPSSSSARGVLPEVRPAYHYEGPIEVNVEAYTRLQIGFRVDIMLQSMAGPTEVALVKQPSMILKTTMEDPSCENGVKLDASIQTRLFVDLNKVYQDLEANVMGSVKKHVGHCLALGEEHQQRSLPGRHDDSHGTVFSKRDSPRIEHTPAVEHKQLKSLDGRLTLHHADNGNVYAVLSGEENDPSALFSAVGSRGSIIGDLTQTRRRLFYGYSDTLADLGVSRLRVADGHHLPKTSVMLILHPVTLPPPKKEDGGSSSSPQPEAKSVMLAFDMDGNSYYPILCVYEKLFPKLFIAKNPKEGALVLENPAYMESLTGGLVKKCGFFAIR